MQEKRVQVAGRTCRQRLDGQQLSRLWRPAARGAGRPRPHPFRLSPHGRCCRRLEAQARIHHLPAFHGHCRLRGLVRRRGRAAERAQRDGGAAERGQRHGGTRQRAQRDQPHLKHHVRAGPGRNVPPGKGFRVCGFNRGGPGSQGEVRCRGWVVGNTQHRPTRSQRRRCCPWLTPWRCAPPTKQDTALANEHVPANDQGFYLPFWQVGEPVTCRGRSAGAADVPPEPLPHLHPPPRPLAQRLLIRSTYVLLCTLVAACMPFFSAIVGLVGAITYWPLSVGAPFLMYTLVGARCGLCGAVGLWGCDVGPWGCGGGHDAGRSNKLPKFPAAAALPACDPTLWLPALQVKKPTGWVVSLMKAVAVVMFVVAIVAIIGSVQSLIVSLSNTTFFG